MALRNVALEMKSAEAWMPEHRTSRSSTMSLLQNAKDMRKLLMLLFLFYEPGQLEKPAVFKFSQVKACAFIYLVQPIQ